MTKETIGGRHRLPRRAFLVGATAATLPLAAARGQGAPEKKEVTMGIGPDWGTSGHAVIAHHKGYFKAEGIDTVNFKVFAAGLVQMEALAAGGIEVAQPAQAPIFTLRAAGVPVVVLASLAAYSDSLAVVTRKAANVKEARDLLGKKIGVFKGSGAEAMMIALFKEYKLDPTKVDLVNLPPPEQLASLATGAIDGICVWQPWVYQASQKTQVDIVHTGAHSHFAANKGKPARIDYTRAVLTTTERFVRANPRLVDALMRAYGKAQAFVADAKNFDETAEIFSKHHNQDLAANKVILKDYKSTLALDAQYLADMNAVQDFLAETGRLRRKIVVEDVTYGGAVAKLSSSLVAIDAKWKP
jgi:ABC-type nitrate/sulfonate/bicarbonate transport system substrate-binding protein